MKKIMIVDDDPDVRRLLDKRLATAGFAVTACEGGAEALAGLAAAAPDLVIMDVNMPGMDGIEACRRIKALRPALPVLFLTARGDVEDRLIGFEAGGRDYIAKPFDFAELLARIKATLSEKEAKETAERRAEAFESMAVTDPLTGLANRRSFDDRFAAELARAGRYGGRLACVMADIAHFKEVNDLHGHAAGDQVLVSVSSIMRDSLRQADIVARYGGEEFVFLLPETESEEAVKLSERIRQAVAALAPEPGRPAVTVSLGVASGATPDLVARADQALYTAKRNGRNRVERT